MEDFEKKKKNRYVMEVFERKKRAEEYYVKLFFKREMRDC